MEECGRGERVLLLIHGNSSCREVFRHQLQGRICDSHRLVAFDLPGHGESSDAPDPLRSYTRSGLAEAVVLGWSLGGHVGIEMTARFPGLRGLMVIGAPPAAFGPLLARFLRDVGSGAAFR